LIEVTTKATDWMAHGACTKTPQVREWFDTYETNPEYKEAAKRVCSTCPVRDVCAEYSTDPELSWGIWAGRELEPTEYERAIPLFFDCTNPGTLRGVFAHDRRTEALCDPCRDFNHRYKGMGKGGVAAVETAVKVREIVASRTKPEGDCLSWTAGTDKHGGPRMYVDGREWQALRYLWGEKHGHLSRTETVKPSCGNVRCVNLEHAKLSPRTFGPNGGKQ
jgi:hypothetical protein